MLMKRSFATLMKVEDQEDGTIKVYGVASTGARDDAGEIITPEAMKAALPDYMKWGAIREMHQPTAAGTALDASVDADGATQLCAHVVDAAAIQKVKTKTYRGFSVGGKVLGRDPKDPTIITKIKLIEVSLVDRPCNPEAEISMWKAADIAGPEGDDMSEKSYQPTNAQVKAHAETLAKAAGKPDRANDFLVKAREELVAKAAAETVSEGGTQVIEDVAAAGDGGAASAEGQGDAAKGAAVEGVDPAAEGDASTETVVDPVAAVQEALARAAKAGKDASDGPFADPKNKKYPIGSAKEIRAAWSYIHMPKNQEGYTSEEVEAIKDKIVEAWKAKIDKDGPPSAEKMVALGDLKKTAVALLAFKAPVGVDLTKGLYMVGRVAHLMDALASVQCGVVYEEKAENDTDSKLPQLASDAVAAMATLLVEMAQEEVAEVLAAIKTNSPELDIIPCDPDCDAVVIELAGQIVDLTKADTALMEKVGKRNSAKDAAAIQASHDHMVGLGAVCDKDNCQEDAEKVALTAERDRLSKALTDTAPQIEALAKRLDEQAQEIAVLKSQPMPPKAAGSSLAVVEKGADANGAPEKTEPDAEDVQKWLATLSPEERTHLAMKATLARPVPIGG
jgi:phage head maturation protease